MRLQEASAFGIWVSGDRSVTSNTAKRPLCSISKETFGAAVLRQQHHSDPGTY